MNIYKSKSDRSVKSTIVPSLVWTMADQYMCLISWEMLTAGTTTREVKVSCMPAMVWTQSLTLWERKGAVISSVQLYIPPLPDTLCLTLLSLHLPHYCPPPMNIVDIKC